MPNPPSCESLGLSFSPGGVADRIAAAMAWAAAALVTTVFAWIVLDLLWHGAGGLSWGFLVEAPQDAGRSGGIGPILVSTGLILIVCMGVCLPIGTGAAVLLAEFTPASRFTTLVRRSLDVLSGVPSIVFGLFGNVFFCQVLGLGFSILSGGLTLACMVLPILIRTSEQALASVSDDYRRAAAALGLSRSGTVVWVLLPAAAPGLFVGVVLGIGRAIAETAALLFTSGYVDRMPASLSDSGRAISVHIYDLTMNVAGGEPNAYASALVLLGMLMMINLLTTVVVRRWLHGRIDRP